MDGAYEIASPEAMAVPDGTLPKIAQDLLSGESLPAVFRALESAIVHDVRMAHCMNASNGGAPDVTSSVTALLEACQRL